jgi:DNA primase
VSRLTEYDTNVNLISGMCIEHGRPGTVPAAEFTTYELVETYEQLAPVLLPHISERSLTLKRFPDDINDEVFLEGTL